MACRRGTGFECRPPACGSRTRRGALPLPANCREEREGFSDFSRSEVSRTHDLNELGMQCSDLNSELVPLFQEAAGLTDFAVLFRYSDAPREPDQAEAEND
jgi:hypothetical protein